MSEKTTLDQLLAETVTGEIQHASYNQLLLFE